ncbi:Ig-like domain-containing protein [Candidatus Marinimicrobia bacterium]|nr:Ig-like domain-containing protein [Candidatus Neomarinimicrobiota bacterium]
MFQKIKLNSLVGFIVITALSLSCDDLPQEIPVADTTPPQAVIIFPIDGEPVAGDVTIQVRATDNESVDSVRFFINQTWVGSDSIGEDDIFEFIWKTNNFVEDDFHFLAIVAYDKKGNEFASFPIRSKADNHDNEPPSAFIINPFSGQFVNGIVEITVEASDNDSIQYVSYFVNNILQGYVIEEPYIFLWNTVIVPDDQYYSIYAIVKDISNNTTTIPPVSVIVDNDIQSDVTPPTGAITSPPAGLTVSGDVSIIVSASDNRAMSEVAFSIDGNYITTATSPPYAYIWDTTQETEDTEHTVSVLLVDLAGNENHLNPISVYVDNDPQGDTTPPIVIITEPAAGQSLTGTVSIEVYSEDNTGVDFIDFYINGESVGTDNTSPYQYEWNTETVVDDMEHILAAVGYDIDGNSSLGTPIAVYVDNFDNNPPWGQIQNPVAGQTVNGTITVEISANDDVAVSSIQLSIDGVPQDTLETYPYTYEWYTTEETEDEDHVISIVISDSSANITYGQPISVYVNNTTDDTTPPVITISNPLSGQTVSGIVSFTALAEDDFGVLEVEFYIDGESVGTDSTSPYQYEWDTVTLTNGTQHTLSSTATDLANHTTIAQPILVTISN